MSETRTTMRWVGALALALVAWAPAPAVAQQAPPPPLEMREVSFPDFEERTLSNGARLLVVPQHEVPFVTVNLVLPGGAVSDPEGQEGVASFMGQLLDRGTETRSKEEVAEAVDFLGASLGAGASDEWITVSLGVVSAGLESGLELMADVVLNPAFPQEELELLRTQTLSSLQVQLSQPGALASRAFARAVYGEHPYGRLLTPASVEAVTREAVVAHHDTWFVPDAALFVVAGDVQADEIAAALEEAFAGWERGTVPEVTYGEAPDRMQPEVVLVHRPGGVQSEVRVGHLLPGGDVEDWTALSVANQVLGGGSSGRLFQVLREERGYTYRASSGVSRQRDRGQFLASMAVRTEVTREAVEELLRLVREIRETPIPQDELQDTKDFMTGSFPLQIETPQQVAGQVTTNRLLGLPPEVLTTFRQRVASVDQAAARAAVQRHIDPQRLVIVVTGDATQLQSQLTTFGHVRVEDIGGNLLTLSDLEPEGPSEAFDASTLEPVTLTYDVKVQDNVVGQAVRGLIRNEAGHWSFTSQVTAGPQEIVQEVVFDDQFGLVSTDAAVSAMGQSMEMTGRVEGDRIVGTMTGPGQEQPIDMAAPEGVVVSDMVELVLWVADLEVGKEITLPVAALQAGSVENVTLTVIDRTEITVPAGTFEAFRVQMDGVEAQTFYARVEAPHIVLRIQGQAQPVVLELAEMGGG